MNFWKDKKVLITGASGFVGSNLTKKLIVHGADVTLLTKHAVTKKSLLYIDNVIPKIHRLEVGSVSDYKLVSHIIKDGNIGHIFHLAAQPLVDVAQNSPLSTFETNIKGTWNVLEAARINKVDKIIIASTAHVYGDDPNVPYKESQDPHPSRPYETSKAAADLLAQSYADTYGLSVEIPRFTNIFGPGDFNLNRIVPKTINAILNGRNIELWDVGAVRDFLYVDDAVHGYLSLASSDLPKTKRHRVFNFGSGNPISINKLVQLMVDISEKQVHIKKKSPPQERNNEVTKQFVSIEKANKILNWEPKISYEEGLRRTYLWYKQYFNT